MATASILQMSHVCVNTSAIDADCDVCGEVCLNTSAVVDARINRCLAHVHRSRRRRDNISGPLFVDGTAAVRPPSGRSAYAYAGEFDP